MTIEGLLFLIAGLIVGWFIGIFIVRLVHLPKKTRIKEESKVLPKYCKDHGCELVREKRYPETKFDPQTGKGVTTYKIYLSCPKYFVTTPREKDWYGVTLDRECYTDVDTKEILGEEAKPDCNIPSVTTIPIPLDLARQMIKVLSYYGGTNDRELNRAGYEQWRLEQVYKR